MKEIPTRILKLDESRQEFLRSQEAIRQLI